MEIWGAQGGNSFGYISETGETSEPNQHAGGLGGYSSGNYTSLVGKNLYIVVGGSGKKTSYRSYSASVIVEPNGGGYNGGGSIPETAPDQHGDCYCGGGGGATHIALASGLLENLSGELNSILLVAGGGGGSCFYRCNRKVYKGGGPGYHYGWGGSGGGTTGGNSTHIYSDNASWPSTGTGGNNPVAALGGGANGNTSSFGKGIASGGGGFYGGNSSGRGLIGGGGGSGYINTSLVKNGSMQTGVQTGNGKALITWMPVL